jgi:hypothetical protein
VHIQNIYDTIRTYEENNNTRIVKSDEVLTARLEHMNAFRTQMERREKEYFTRVEHETYVIGVERDLRVCRDFMAKAEGKASQNSVIVAFVLSMIGIALGIAHMFK